MVDLLRGNTAAQKKLQYYIDNFEPLTTTAINAAELFKGAYMARDQQVEVGRVRGVLQRLELLDMSMTACESFGKLVQQQRAQGHPIGDLDTLIASTALTLRQILLTKNKSHFEKIPGLAIETW